MAKTGNKFLDQSLLKGQSIQSSIRLTGYKQGERQIKMWVLMIKIEEYLILCVLPPFYQDDKI